MKKCLILLSFMIITGCSISEQDTSTINLFLGTGSKTSSRFAGAPPTNISSYTLTVTGSGMSTITRTFNTGTTHISVEVPSGNNRQIELVCELGPSSPSAVLSFKGTATTNLPPGRSVNVSLDMSLYETKIIFPNPDANSGAADPRIIQLDSFHDSPIELRLAQINPANEPITTFNPYDIDFDITGTIYIANNDPSADSGVIRIDNFVTPNPIKVARFGTTVGIRTIAIDINNNYLYHSRGNDLRRTNLTTASFPDQGTSIDITSISATPYIVAITVDNEGMLYISDAGNVGVEGDDQFIKFNPNTPEVIYSYAANIDFRQFVGGNTHNYSDILFMNDYVYLANLDGINNNLVLQFNTELQLLDGYGIRAPDNTTDTAIGHFYGPHFFVARRKDEFIIMDEAGSNVMGDGYDKLVYMEDMDGTGWDYNDSFSFYYEC